MSEFSERSQVMHKDFIPSVSIEEFAAYLDGNLTEDGMNDIASAIHSDDSLQDIMSSCHTIDDTIANYEPLQLTVPEDIAADFEIPQVDDNDYLNVGDCANWDVAACAADPFTTDIIDADDDTFSMSGHTDITDDSTDISSYHLENDLNDTMSNDNELIDLDNTDLNDL